jgi:hypothetical protein
MIGKASSIFWGWPRCAIILNLSVGIIVTEQAPCNLVLTRRDYEASLSWIGVSIESEMALFSECIAASARKARDTAEIVRGAIYR